MEIFFDLDGTLIDISERYYQLYSEIVKKLGGRPLKKSYYWHLKRSCTHNEKILLKSNLANSKISLFDLEFLKNIELPKYLSYDKVFPYTKKILNLLVKKHNLYLVSYRRNTENANKQLTELGLIEKFRGIRIGRLDNDGCVTKVRYIHELARGGKKLVVGDTDDEILAAQQVEAISLAVLSGIRNRHYLEQLSPDYIVQDIRSIPSILNKMKFWPQLYVDN